MFDALVFGTGINTEDSFHGISFEEIKHGAEKIRPKHVTRGLGGGSLNVTIGLVRLGFSANLIAFTARGDPEYLNIGAGIDAVARREQFCYQNVPAKDVTSHATVYHFDGGTHRIVGSRGRLAYWNEHRLTVRTLDENEPGRFWLVHGLLAVDWPQACEFLDFQRQLGVHRVLGVNNSLLEDSAVCKEVFSKTEYVFLNHQELAQILGRTQNAFYNPEQISRHLFDDEFCHHRQLRCIVVTCAERGSAMFQRSDDHHAERVIQPPFEPPAGFVDGTGAGDALVVGFIAGLCSNYSPQTCLLCGAANATLMVSRQGGSNMPRARELNQYLAQLGASISLSA